MIFQLLFIAMFGNAQSTHDGVIIKNADSMYSDQVKKTVKLEGRVQVVFQGQSLNADTALLNSADQTIDAEGHVILESLKAHIEGTRLHFNYKTNTGVIYNGFVQSGQVIFEGDFIEKTGLDTYIAQNAEYTACDTCPPGWAFSGRTIEAEIGGYAYIKRAVFKVGGIPIMIFPAMLVPLKSTRSSGFLVPGLEFSSLGGTAITDSYFWAIDRSHDLTLTATTFTKRGPSFAEDYRYVYSPVSRGDLQSAVVTDDRSLKNEYFLNSAPDRWYVHYQHYFELPDDYVSRVDFKPVSDVRYPRDFPLDLPGLGDPSLESKASITKNTETNHFSAEGILNTNLLTYYPMPDNTDAIHKLPELNYSSREQRLGSWGPLVRWNVDYVNFASNQYSYDSLAPDPNITFHPGYLTGVQTCPSCQYPTFIHNPNFDPSTDLMRTGQRLDVQPTISYPFQIAHLFDILPSVTYREMQYRFDVPEGAEEAGYSPTAARRYMQGDIDGKTEFSTIFGGDGDKDTRWRHSFIPEMSYEFIPWIREPNHPFFGQTAGLPYYRQNNPISDSDIYTPSTSLIPGTLGAMNNGLQFDYDDRVYQRELTTFTLTQKLVRKRWTDIYGNTLSDPVYQRVALFKIMQSYDFYQQGGTYNQPWSTTDALLNITLDHYEVYTTGSYNPYANVTNWSTMLKWKLDLKNYFLVNYSRTYLFDNYNNVIPGSETEDYGAGLGYTSKYFDVGGLFDYSFITHGIQSYQVFGIVRPGGNCWHIKVNASQDLGGAFSYHFDFAFDFMGAPHTSTPGATPASAPGQPGNSGGGFGT